MSDLKVQEARREVCGSASFSPEEVLKLERIERRYGAKDTARAHAIHALGKILLAKKTKRLEEGSRVEVSKNLARHKFGIIELTI